MIRNDFIDAVEFDTVEINNFNEMKTNDIFEFWDKGNRELLNQSDFSKEAIEKYIRKNTGSTSWYLGFNLIFHCIFLMACIITSSMNLPGYWHNPVIKPVVIFQLVLSLLFLLYGIIIYIRFREIKKYQTTTWELINKQLKF